MTANKLTSTNEIEAANRAEVTAVLIRAGYRVYRPEADVSGEDLVIRIPEGELRSVQMKGPSSCSLEALRREALRGE
jgi:hemolysin activation/secretion protein